jgi:hypothetical protein
MWKKLIVTYFKLLSRYSLEGLRNTMKHLRIFAVSAEIRTRHFSEALPLEPTSLVPRILNLAALDGSEWSTSRPGRFALTGKETGWLQIGSRHSIKRKISCIFWESNPQGIITLTEISLG